MTTNDYDADDNNSNTNSIGLVNNSQDDMPSLH